MKTKRIPLRRCIACRRQLPKRELLRIVRTPEQILVYDSRGKISGRGAYLCGKRSCLDKAVKQNLFRRHLGLHPDDELLAVLEELSTKGDENP